MENQTKDALIARIKALAIEYKTLRAAPMGQPKTKNEGAQEVNQVNIGETLEKPANEATSGGDIGDDAKAKEKIEAAIKNFSAQLDSEKAQYEKKLKDFADILAKFKLSNDILVEKVINGKTVLVLANGVKDQIRALINNHTALITQWVSVIFDNETLISSENVKIHIFNNSALYKSTVLTDYENKIYIKFYGESTYNLAQSHIAYLKNCRNTFSAGSKKQIEKLKTILGEKQDPKITIESQK